MLTFRTLVSTQVSYVLGKECGTKEGIPVTDGERIEKKKGYSLCSTLKKEPPLL